MENDPFVVIVSSPSGAGKTTICKNILSREHQLAMSISVTTRIKRGNEIDGVDYIFKNHDEFDKLIAGDYFLEWATVFNNKYGTPRSEVKKYLATGKSVLFDIDWQGAQTIRQSGLDVVSFFILPPSIKVLEERIKSRAQNTIEDINLRLNGAMLEISHYHEYDYVVINNSLEEAIDRVYNIIQTEKLRRTKNCGIKNFIQNELYR